MVENLRGGQFNGGTLTKGEWSCYMMVMLQRWCLMEGP